MLCEPLSPKLVCPLIRWTSRLGVRGWSYLKIRGAWWEWTDLILIEEFWKPPSRFNMADPWRFLQRDFKLLADLQIWRCRSICIGSWLPSESGRNLILPLCPERKAFHGYSPATNYLPFQCAVEEIKFFSLPEFLFSRRKELCQSSLSS